ncbi:MAG: glutathione S-transferase N-terminal domain-containing protein [Bdellovibrionota bacterium]
MKLYYSPGSCSLAPHIVMEELGLKYEAIKVDLRNKDEAFKELNRKGYVPALVTDDDQLITENAAILQYLAAQKPELKLFPTEGMAKYRGLEALNFIATEVHKGFGNLWGMGRIFPDNQAAAKTLGDFTVANLGRKFDVLTETIQQSPFILGKEFSVCDAYLFTVLGWTKFLKVDMSKWPELLAYMERIQARPSVKAAMKAEGILQ